MHVLLAAARLATRVCAYCCCVGFALPSALLRFGSPSAGFLVCSFVVGFGLLAGLPSALGCVFLFFFLCVCFLFSCLSVCLCACVCAFCRACFLGSCAWLPSSACIGWLALCPLPFIRVNVLRLACRSVGVCVGSFGFLPSLGCLAWHVFCFSSATFGCLAPRFVRARLDQFVDCRIAAYYGCLR